MTPSLSLHVFVFSAAACRVLMCCFGFVAFGAVIAGGASVFVGNVVPMCVAVVAVVVLDDLPTSVVGAVAAFLELGNLCCQCGK